MRCMQRHFTRIASTAGVVLLTLAALPARAETPTVTATFSQSTFHPGRTYPTGLIVAVMAGETRKPGITVTVQSLNTPIRVGVPGQEATSKAEGETDTAGRIVFTIDTRELKPTETARAFALSVHAEVDGEVLVSTETALLGSGFESSFSSDRVSSELFLGGSLGRAYDETGKSTGFRESSFVGRLRVDTLWTQDKASAFHTGLEIQLSSFPTTDSTEPAGGITSYADAFTGSLVVIFQPGWKPLAQYTETSRSSRLDRRFDALRVGLIGRYGLTSRERKSSEGDTDLQYFRGGILITHHQTNAKSAKDDNVNVFPMRYVELSYGRYEQIFDRRNADRFVLEAGFRLPGIGTDAVPFYAGIFLNAGDGQDDLRVFAGLLFQINKLVELFAR